MARLEEDLGDGMKIIVGERRSGKTTKLIEMCAKQGGYIVCINRHEAQRVLAEAKGMGLKIPLPITFTDIRNQRYCVGGVKKLYLDNAELFLGSLVSVPIVAITMTMDEEDLG